MSDFYKIEDICLIKGGKRIPEGETLQETPNDHPYIRILDMYQGRILELSGSMMYARVEYISKIKKYIVNEGDIILAIVGNTLGMVSTIGKSLNNANLTENCCKFVDINTNKVLPLFLYYSLISPFNQKKIEKFKVGSSQPKLPLYNVGQLLIPKIAISHQQEIVMTLSAIDSKIECSQKICSELAAMAKTLYDYWFVQFDFPDANGKPYRTFGGEMIWNEQLKREIPKGWNVGRLVDIANITMGQSPVGESYNEMGEGIIFYQGRTDFGLRFPTPRMYTTEPTRFAKKGDILLSVRAPVGDLNLAMENCCIGRGLAALNSKIGSQTHLFYTLSGFKQIFDIMDGNGTTFGSITKDILFDMRVVIPPNAQLHKFEKYVKPVEKQIQVYEQEIRELIKLRDWLLPMLMNGQARVE